MTINTLSITDGPYAGNGVATSFAYNFRIDENTEIAVYETDPNGTVTKLTLTTHYTVSGVGSPSGGSVTRVAGALPSGYTWYIRSAYVPTQLTAFASQGGFFPDVHEYALDKLSFVAQQLQDELNRSLRLDISDPSIESGSMLLPPAVQRSQKYVGFDVDGNVVMLEGSGTATDAAQVNFTSPGIPSITRTVSSKLSDVISVFDFMTAAQIADVTAGTLLLDVTSAIQAAITAMAGGSRYALYFPAGSYGVTSISMGGVGKKLHIISDGASLFGTAAVPTTAMVAMTDPSNITFTGRLGVNAQHNANYTAGVDITVSSGAAKAQYLNLQSLFISAVMTAVTVGSTTYPSAVVSEIYVSNLETYQCPNIIKAVGTNLFVFITSSTLSSETAGWGVTPILTQYVINAVGSTVMVSGSEILHTGTTTDAAIAVDTLANSTATQNVCGRVFVEGVEIEAASPLAVTLNTGALAAPVLGMVSFIGCTGWHGGNTDYRIKSDATFTGDIVVKDCHFYAGVSRTFGNIQALGSANIYCDDQSFGRNYVQGQAGIVGGITHYAGKCLIDVSDANGQTITGAVLTTVIYSGYTNAGNNARFAVAGYNATTGVFTVPAGGLEDVTITAMFRSNTSLGTDSTLNIYINGVQRKSIYLSNGSASSRGEIVGVFRSLAAGDTVEIKAFKPTAGNVTLPAGADYNSFQIVASR